MNLGAAHAATLLEQPADADGFIVAAGRALAALPEPWLAALWLLILPGTRADEALYRAKNDGRDGLCVHSGL